MSLATSLAGGGGGAGGSGDFVGPASSTDNAVVRFDGTTGKLGQNSVVTISDAGAVAGVTLLDVDNIRVDGNTISSQNANGDINLTPNGSGNVVSTRSFNTSVAGQAYIAGTSNSDYNIGLVGGGTPSLRMQSAAVVGGSATGNANDALDWSISRAAAADIAFGNGTAGNATAVLKFGNGRCRGITSSAGAASTTEYPTAGDWGLHDNTAGGTTHLVRNKAGAIISVQLT